MKTFTYLALLIAFITLAVSKPVKVKKTAKKLNTSTRQFVNCGQQCLFEFCENDSTVFLGIGNVPLTGPICMRNGPNQVGRIISTGEALVSQPGIVPGPISSVFGAGTFPSNFFGAFDIPGTSQSGVGSMYLEGNQNVLANGLCVTLPITDYDLINGNSGFSSNRPQDCVAFRTVVPRLQVELEWDSGDDLDLQVFEPDNDLVDADTPSSESGTLLDDVRDLCRLRSGLRRERVVYRNPPTIQNGVYRFQARHFSNCGNGRTRWGIYIYIDGELTQSRTGVSNRDNDNIIPGSVFTFPVAL